MSNDERNWDDERSPEERIDDGYERGLHERELEDKRQAHEHKEELHSQRKELFSIFKKYTIWMIVFGYALAAIVVFKPSTQGALITGLVIMVPVVIILAMIRMLYGSGDQASKTAPSIVLNIGKELANVIKAYIKTGSGGGAS